MHKLTKPIIYLALMALCIYLAQALQLSSLGMVAVTLLFFAAWLFSSFAWGINTKVCILFSSIFFIKPLFVSFYVILALTCFCLITEYYQSQRKSLIWPYPYASFILIGTCLYGLFRSSSIENALSYFFATAIVPMVFLVSLSNSKIEAKDFKLWIKLLVYINVFLAVVGVFMALLNPNQRYGSLWITAMTINGFYTLGFFFSIALGIQEHDKLKSLLWYLSAFVIFLGMLYTYTRMALLAVFFGFFLMMLRMKRFRLLGIIAMLLIPLLIPASMMGRIQKGFTFDMSIIIRLFAWYHALRQISLHPFFGIGISTWKKWYLGVVPISYLYAEHPHNLFLKVFVEIGVFGFLSYFWIIFQVLYRFWRQVVKASNSYFYSVVLIGIIALIFSCITDIFIQQYSISIAFWTSLAFMHLLTQQQNKAENEKQ